MAEIRRIGPDDWQLLKSVRLEALADAPYAFGSTHAEEQLFDEAEWRSRLERFAWFAAVDGDKGVGLIAGASFSPEPARGLIAMWAHSNVRGSSVAADLVNAVARWARNDGAGELLLWVADGNDRARRFYERMGFLPTGNRRALRSNPAVEEEELRLVL